MEETGSPTAERPYQSARPRLAAVRATLGLAALGVVIAVLVALDRRAALADAYHFGLIAPGRLDDLDDRQRLVEILLAVTLIVAAIAWLRWFSRLYGNLPALGGRSLRYGQRWSVLGWVIPVVNVYQPFKQTTDVWRVGSSPQRTVQFTDAQAKPPLVIKCWWAGFIAGPGVAGIGQRIADSATTSSTPVTFGTFVQCLGYGLTLAATLLADRLAQDLTCQQEERSLALSARQAPVEVS